MVRKTHRPSGVIPSREVTSEACGRTRRLLGSYLDGQLEPGPRSEVERHLASCFACTGTLMKARRGREAFNRVLRDTLAEGNAAPTKLRENVSVCLHCFTSPGSVRCPKLHRKLRLVPQPPEAL